MNTTVGEAVFLVNRAGIVTAVNEALAARLGKGVADCVGQSVFSLLPGYAVAGRREVLDRVLLTGRPAVLEDEWEGRWSHFSFSPLPGADGAVDRLAIVEMDITERKRGEEALQESNDYHRNLLEASLDPLVTIGRSGQIADVNAATEQATGYARQDLIGTDFSDYFTEPERAREAYERVFKDGSVRDYPLDIRHCDGHTTAVQYNAVVYLDESGQVRGVLAAARDISGRKRAEDMLHELNDYNRNLLEVSLDALVTIGRSGQISDVNAAAERATGLSRWDLIGTDFSSYFTEPERAREVYQLVFRDGAVRDYPLEMRHRDGRTTPVLYNAVVYRDKGGQICGVLAAARDITERKRAEEALALLNAQLAVKNKELEQVVYVASHDLRSPLVNLAGYGREVEFAVEELTRILDADFPSPDALKAAARPSVQEMADALRYIRSSTTQMDKLLTGLLKLSRSGKAALTIGPLDMNALLATVVAGLDFQATAAGAEVTVAELPPCTGDALQVGQVFTNLLGNALKYLDPARPGVIRISGVVLGKRSTYCVADNGIGIAAAHQENIFEIFHRLEPSKREGEGLGLTIVRQALGRLAGDIRVESQPGAGSRFFASLPAAHPGNT